MPFSADIKSLFEPDLIKELEAKASLLKVHEGDVILEIGQPIRLIPLIISGTLKITRIDENGNELLLYYLNPLETCALSLTCCMQEFPSEIQAIAEEDSEIIAVPIFLMNEWMQKYFTWKSFVMKSIRNRFNEMLKTIDQIAFQKLDDRLIHYLKEKSKVSGSSILNVSHEQIAQDLATSRVVISRLLKTLENNQKVLLYRNQIKLLRDMYQK
ncbi:MAG: Crp/Fnr family transcriptional regulator [Saprospiraceae bacterium]